MKQPKPDIPGIVCGTLLTGGAAAWMLADAGVLSLDDLGVTAALMLVVAGIVGLVASQRN